MESNNKSNNKDEEPRPIVIRNTTDLQRLKLEKLMKNPEKAVVIPEKPKGRSMPNVPDFVRNVMGSSAGAGSGEFHVYRHLRRKEYARQKFISEKSEREKLNDEYHQKLEDNRIAAEQKTAKKRAKRQKRKIKAKGKKIKVEKPQSSSSESSPSESEDEQSNTNNDDKEKEVENKDEVQTEKTSVESSDNIDKSLNSADNNKEHVNESSNTNDSNNDKKEVENKDDVQTEKTSVESSDNIDKSLNRADNNLEQVKESLDTISEEKEVDKTNEN